MSALPTPRMAWAVIGSVLAALLLGILTWGAGVGPRSGDGEPVTQGPVIFVGVPGLSWDDISPETTPTLAEWEDNGAAGALVVRGAYPLTCPGDGWMTLGTGERVAPERPGDTRSGATDCPPAPELDSSGPGNAVTITNWDEWQAAADERPVSARLGSLTASVVEAGGCVQGHGLDAAVASADESGQALGSRDWRSADLGSCAVHLIALDPIGGLGVESDPRVAANGAPDAVEAAAAIDDEVAAIASAAPAGTTIIVAGLADRDDRPGIRAVLASTDVSGAITSPATRQPGITQTTDLTATLIAAAGGTVPAEVSGSPIRILTDRTPGDADVRDIAVGGTLTEVVAGPVLAFLAIGSLLAVGVTAALRRRSRATAVALTAMMAAPVATYLAELVPWWRVATTEATGGELWRAGLLLGAVSIGWVLALTAAAWAGPWRTRWATPPLLIAAVTLVVVCLEIVWGNRLSLTATLGSPLITAGRFFGAGNVAAGILLGAMAVVMAIVGAALAGRAREDQGVARTGEADQQASASASASAHDAQPPRRHRWAAGTAILALGILVALIDGAPQWGADFGGVAPIVVTTGLIALPAFGVRVTLPRAVLIGTAAAVVTAAIMLMDWLRPAEQRTHLGNFVQSMIDGGAWDIVVRKFDENAQMLIQYPAAWAGLAFVVLLVWAVLAPDSRPGQVLKPLWDVPLMRESALAILAGGLVGWAINDSGIGLVGLAFTLAIPALAITRLAVAPSPSPSSERAVAGI